MKKYLVASKYRLKATLQVLLQPMYAVLGVMSSLIITAVIVWSLNAQLAWFVITQPALTVLEKADFFIDGTLAIYSSYESPQAFFIIVFSVLFGINTALFVFALRANRTNAKTKALGGSATLLGIIGGGCIACGTSLITPILITLGVGSAAVMQDISILLIIIGSVLLGFSIHKLANIAATYFASQ